MSENRISVIKRKPTLDERDEAAEQALAARYDALNRLITQAELGLRVLKPIHSVSVTYNENVPDAGPQQWEILFLDKHGGKWRICHATGNAASDELYDYKPLVECPIMVRVRAAEIVRRLRRAVIKSKEAFIPEVDAAINELTEFCSEI